MWVDDPLVSGEVLVQFLSAASEIAQCTTLIRLLSYLPLRIPYFLVLSQVAGHHF